MAVNTETRGRRSLSGAGESPQLRLRMSGDLRAALQRRAADDGITLSELARRLLVHAVKETPAPEVDNGRASSNRLSGPLGRRVVARRRDMLASAATYGLSNVRVFGSVARGSDEPGSDIDLLVDVPDGMGLFALGRARADLERILNAPVDLVPSTDLKPDVALSLIAELTPL